MSIKVLFFASLRERVGMGQAEVAGAPGMQVGAVWREATDNAEPPKNLLCARNQEYVGFDEPVQDGDEVAFFPPVTGG